jgi:DNA-binding transcriptional LysR family regulator
MDMETKYLRYFLQVCEDKSLSSAARKLFLSQQALSSVIRKLEDRFGVTLFERAPNGMHLTEFGECLHGQAKKIISLVDETYGKIEILKADRRDTLSFGMSFGVMSALPQNYFVNFQKKHPDVELHFTEYPDTLCEKAVLDDREQIGFDIAPINGSLFDTHPIVRDRFCILAHINGRFYDLPSVPVAALAGEKFLLLDRKFKLRALFEAKCRESGFDPQCALETMELVLIHNFSSLDRGVGVGVAFIARDIPNIRPVPFEPDWPWEVCLITRKGRQHSETARCFLRYAKTVDCYYPGVP